MAPRVQKDRRLLGQGVPNRRYLIRVGSSEAPPSVWRDTHETCSAPNTEVRVTVPNETVDAVRAIKPSKLTFELDVFSSFTAVGKRGERPQMPFMMMVVEPNSGFILGIELLSVEGPVEDMWVQVPAKFLEMVKRHRARPASLALRTPWVFTVMSGLCQDLGIAIKADPELRALEQARREMDRFAHR